MYERRSRLLFPTLTCLGRTASAQLCSSPRQALILRLDLANRLTQNLTAGHSPNGVTRFDHDPEFPFLHDLQRINAPLPPDRAIDHFARARLSYSTQRGEIRSVPLTNHQSSFKE